MRGNKMDSRKRKTYSRPAMKVVNLRKQIPLVAYSGGFQ